MGWRTVALCQRKILQRILDALRLETASMEPYCWDVAVQVSLALARELQHLVDFKRSALAQ